MAVVELSDQELTARLQRLRRGQSPEPPPPEPPPEPEPMDIAAVGRTLATNLRKVLHGYGMAAVDLDGSGVMEVEVWHPGVLRSFMLADMREQPVFVPGLFDAEVYLDVVEVRPHARRLRIASFSFATEKAGAFVSLEQPGVDYPVMLTGTYELCHEFARHYAISAWTHIRTKRDLQGYSHRGVFALFGTTPETVQMLADHGWDVIYTSLHPPYYEGPDPP